MMVTGCSLTRENKNLKESTLKKTAQTRMEEWFNTDYQAIIDQVEQQDSNRFLKPSIDVMEGGRSRESIWEEPALD